MRWAERVARVGGKQIHVGFWWRDVKERNDLEYLRIDGMVLINNDWD